MISVTKVDDLVYKVCKHYDNVRGINIHLEYIEKSKITKNRTYWNYLEGTFEFVFAFEHFRICFHSTVLREHPFNF